jgi:hypothetical protein
MRAVALNGVEVRRRQEEIDHFDARAQVGGDLYPDGSSDVSSATSNTGHATKIFQPGKGGCLRLQVNEKSPVDQPSALL